MSSYKEGIAKEIEPLRNPYMMVKRGRSSVLIEKPYQTVLDQLRRLGKSPDDYHSLATAYQNAIDNAKVLGVREETTRRFLISLDDEEIESMERTPVTIRNFWLGAPHVRLYTPDEAKKREYAGRNALAWASEYEKNPEMVVHANDGYFYAATKNDAIISMSEELITGRQEPHNFDRTPRPRGLG